MEVYVYTHNCITNGELDYSISQVFASKEQAKEMAKKELDAQYRAWEKAVEPKRFRKAQGYVALQLYREFTNLAGKQVHVVHTFVLEAREIL